MFNVCELSVMESLASVKYGADMNFYKRIIFVYIKTEVV